MGGKEYLPPRGLRDIVGDTALIYEYVFNEFRRIAGLHSFYPIIPPTIEYYRLFEEKSGEEIKKTMYVFRDKAGRILALRPEVTASVVRVYLRLLRGEPKPLKLYYVAQCFRYEEPQHGRYREFWQGGLEVIGVPDLSGDLEAAYTASRFLDSIGVRHEYIVGNVALHRSLLTGYGVPSEAQDHILHLIDKSLYDEALDIVSGYGDEAAEGLRKLLSTRLEDLGDFITEFRGRLAEPERVAGETDRLTGFIESLRDLGYDARYDPGLVRGLAYYTGLIYEYKARNPRLRISIGGGGRYDGLSTVYGGPFEYFTGLALGLDRVILAMEGMKPGIKRSPIVAVITVKDVPLSRALEIKSLLEEHGLSSTILTGRRIGKLLGIASRRGVSAAVIIGPREFREGVVIAKDMGTGEQRRLPPEALPLHIIEMIKD